MFKILEETIPSWISRMASTTALPGKWGNSGQLGIESQDLKKVATVPMALDVPEYSAYTSAHSCSSPTSLFAHPNNRKTTGWSTASAFQVSERCRTKFQNSRCMASKNVSFSLFGLYNKGKHRMTAIYGVYHDPFHPLVFHLIEVCFHEREHVSLCKCLFENCMTVHYPSEPFTVPLKETAFDFILIFYLELYPAFSLRRNLGNIIFFTTTPTFMVL